MTLRELANQLNRPVGDVIKALTLKGFKGIHKQDHIVPSEAIKVVAELLENNSQTQVALPSANTAPITESVPEAPKTASSEGITQLQDRVENTFKAVTEARQHIGSESFQQEVDNRALAGVVTALAGQASYNEAYLKTVGMLYGRDINEQQKAITSILDTITNPDFFGQANPAESYFKVSEIKASNALLQQATASAEALK